MLLSHVGLFASASTAGEALAGVAGPTVAWALAGGYAVAPAAHAGCVEKPIPRVSLTSAGWDRG